MDLGQQAVLHFHIKCGADLVQQRIDLGVAIAAPVNTVGRDVAAVHKPGNTVEGVGGDVGQIDRGNALAGVHIRLGTAAPVQVQVLQFHHFKGDLNIDFGQTLLNEFVHGKRQHLAGTALRNDDLGLERVGFGVTGLRHQGAGGRQVVPNLESRLAKPRTGLVHLALCHRSQAAHQLDHGISVNRQIGSLAHPNIGPGRARLG